jgi:hypothetical protein
MRVVRSSAALVVAMLVAAVLVVPLASEADARPGQSPQRRCAGLSEPTGSLLDYFGAFYFRHQQCLRLNQVQVLGTHNSYKQPTTPEVLDAVFSIDQSLGEGLDYSHPPFGVQLGQQGVRQFELDVFADPEGGRWANRIVLDALGLPNPVIPELTEPGFKVLHAQEIDFNTHCYSLVNCLQQLKYWSFFNPLHLPIAIMLELKVDPVPDPVGLGFVQPLPFGPAELDALDAEIRSVFSEDEIISPDDVRGDYATLEEAVLDGNWPTLREARGKVMFLMDNGGQFRDDYRDGHPSLEGRPIFTNSFPGEPDAAFVKVNNPIGQVERIQQLVSDGYVVRTRSDEPTIQARSNDRTQLEAALASGAQWISTDYPSPNMSPFSDYVVELPGGAVGRCNPVNTGPRCRDHRLERLRPWSWAFRR